MKRLIIDLDETVTLSAQECYADALPNLALIARLREYQEIGFDIVISTSRNMRTFSGNIGKINAVTLPVIITWLEKHNVPFDEIYVGKPWCGLEGFYVDDKAIRPSEFLRYSLPEIKQLLADEKGGC
ncbi:MAG: capsular biosynthesis protein [Pseudomonadota bacterium]